MVKGLTGIKTAGIVSPTQLLAILAVVGLSSAAPPNCLFQTLPDICSAFLGGWRRGWQGIGAAQDLHHLEMSAVLPATMPFGWSATLPVTGFLFFTCSFSTGSLRKWSHRKRIVCLLWTMGDSFVCLYKYLYSYLQVEWAICWHFSSSFGWFYYRNKFYLFYSLSSCPFEQLQWYCHYWKGDQSRIHLSVWISCFFLVTVHSPRLPAAKYLQSFFLTLKETCSLSIPNIIQTD